MQQNNQSYQRPQILLPSDYMSDSSYDVGDRSQRAIPAFIALLRDAKDAASAKRTFDIEMSKMDENDARDLITEIVEEFPSKYLRPGEELVRLASDRRKWEQVAEMKREGKRKVEAREKAVDSYTELLRDALTGHTGFVESDSTEPTAGSKDPINEA